ncbi:acyl-CoA synthetase [Oceanicola sp. 22II-s10i]|uniref:acyl-CoA synthetase n=1 Tax=Oceanicola sp. 22II-s10i TaxID=1317116 RepID=UPI000B52859C|nr:acyl-CoA synthetase [Oceanicola sp. 22II-s10i]
MSQTEYRHVGYWAEQTPDRPAIIDAATGEVVTFAQYEALSNRVAQLVRSLGLKRHDHVVFMSENRTEFMPWFWGFIRAGLRATPIPTHLSREEIDYILRDCDASLFLTTAAMAPTATRVDLGAIRPEARLMADGPAEGFADFDAALAAMPDTPIPDQSEGIEMLYSSGTTGRPKGVRKPMPDVEFGTYTPALQNVAARWRFGPDVVYLHPSPLYHAAPLGFANRVNRLGGCIVVMKKFDAEACLANIERFGVTHSQWVPTHFIRLLRLPPEVRSKYDLSTLSMAIHAAAPCPHDVKRAMIDWWGPVIEEYYAGSEGNGQCNLTSAEWLEKPGSVGKAHIGVLHICDEDFNEVPTGEIGTIFFESPATFEYHNDPEKTAGARHPKGWTTLGDVGYVDEDGYLFLTDRKTFMIISGGVNIYPQEIEAVLLTHPKIDDAAVFGIPNADFGEEVKAVVELKPGVNADAAMSEEIIAFCREHLSHVKCPRTVDFIDEMPRGDNGKLYKKILREPYWRDRGKTLAEAVTAGGGTA